MHRQFVRHINGFCSCIVAATLLAGATAHAQVTPSAEPQKIERRFDEVPQPEATREPLVGLRGGQQIPANADQVRFVLNDVKVTGATAYDDGALRQYYSGLIGQEVTLRKAYEIAAAINEQYLRDGYVLTRALLETPVRGGTVNIRVVEGYVSNVVVQTVEDADASPLEDSRQILSGYAQEISKDRPLNSKTLERFILLADDLPGVTAKAVLRPVNAETGDNQLVMLIGFERFEGSYTVNNRGTELQGPWQHQATATANSLLGLFERTSVRGITTSPTDELVFVDVLHEQQLDKNGTRLSLLVSHVDSEPGDFLKPLNIESNAQRFVATVDHPFIRSRKENLRGRVSFGVRNSETDILGTQLSEDRLRVVRLGGTYDIADKWNGVNLIDLEISQGLDMFGATDAGVGRSRVDGEADFTKFNADLARLQNIGSGFSVLLQAAGQYSLDPLLSAEEFIVGGGEFGRAYDPAEIASDHGLAGKLEFRYGQGLPAEALLLQSYQFFAYYDAGVVWNENSPAGVDDSTSLTALGFGVRTNMDYNLSGSAEIGFPLTRDVAIENSDSPRMFVSLTKRF